MGLFGKSHTDKRLDHLNSALALSFSKIRHDTSKLFEWINYLHQQNIHQSTIIDQLQKELQAFPKSNAQVRALIDHSYNSVSERISHLNQRVDQILSAQLPIMDNLEQMHQEVTKDKPKVGLKQKILKRITKNSKTYVKNLILSFIRKYEKISALTLREMIVDEQELCSKSSFYRILEELEQEEDVTVISDGKQKVYMMKILKRN
jgi:uncharacterized protein YoxC